MGGNLIAADEKAEVQNAFFASVFSGKAACPQDNCPPGLVDGVREQNGPPVIQDNLRPGELAKPLSIVYQQSWLTGEVPDDWKLANVTPIHKKGRNPGNYRPVSLTSVPGKNKHNCQPLAFLRSLVISEPPDADGIGENREAHMALASMNWYTCERCLAWEYGRYAKFLEVLKTNVRF
ncbi:hypothetical protein DUI87_15974 [Hirundo rustica rustica]|uniref:Uncharacterized protein n=1 Tax=Hirundo rustica rustica TaxID=333673 RepID=A0A3M0KHA2_HIRRU|nr:hypothetical protein DUI87_15974 [Hirundo rustica rustica]